MTKLRPRSVLVLALFGTSLVTAGLAGCDEDSSSGAVTSLDGGDTADTGVTSDASDRATEAAAEAAASCQLAGSYGSKECNACMGKACCAETAACYGDPECKLLDQCLRDCLLGADAGGCYKGCRATHPSASPLWDPVEKCWFSDPPKGCLIECT